MSAPRGTPARGPIPLGHDAGRGRPGEDAPIPISVEDIERAVLWRRAYDDGMARAAEERRAARDLSTWEIRAEFDNDVARGLRPWGRATRISRKLKIPLRTVSRKVAALNKIGLDGVQAK